MAVTINGTTGISSVDGSSSSPSLRGTDSNSGIVYAADTVSISTGGTERLEVDSSGNIDIPDNGKIRLGGAGDLSLYHDGSTSYIEDVGTGILRIRGNEIRLCNTSNETYFTGTENGAASLYYDDTITFQTTSNGHMIKMTSGHPTFRIHCDTDSSPLASIELMRGANDSWGAGGYTDWQLSDGSGGTFIIVQGENGSSWTRLSISTSGVVSGDLNDTSDEKKKKNITSISDGAIAKIKQLRPVNFNWKDPLNTANQSGFIAQEIKTVIPDLVVGKEYDETENPIGYAINTTGVVAHLTKALQEAIAKIETLETKVAALEAHTHE